MFGFSNARPLPSPLGELQRHLHAVEGFIDRLSRSSRGRVQAETLAGAMSERLSTVADRLRRRASSVPSDASRLGDHLSGSGRDALAVLAKEVSGNPLAAVGAAVAPGLVFGVALRRGPSALRHMPEPRKRRVSRRSK
jgi:hypothetical protein